MSVHVTLFTNWEELKKFEDGKDAKGYIGRQPEFELAIQVLSHNMRTSLQSDLFIINKNYYTRSSKT
jgi:hypothetical protein